MGQHNKYKRFVGACNTDSFVILPTNNSKPKNSNHYGIVGNLGVNGVLANVFAQLITWHVTYICYTHKVIVINIFLSTDSFDFLSFLIGHRGPAEVERLVLWSDCPVNKAANHAVPLTVCPYILVDKNILTLSYLGGATLDSIHF